MRPPIALTGVLLGLVSVLGPMADAYEVPVDAINQNQRGGGPVMPGSRLVQTIITSGPTRLSDATTMAARGAGPATYWPRLVPSAPAQDISVGTGDCPAVGLCASRGTITLTSPDLLRRRSCTSPAWVVSRLHRQRSRSCTRS